MQTRQQIFHGQGASVANFAPGFSGGAVNTSSGTQLTAVNDPTIATTYYLSDQVNTVQMEVTGSGTPVWKGAFTPFGQEIDNQFTTNNDKFTGKERESEVTDPLGNGLDHFGARYYASSMGRFSSPDPSGLVYADPTNPQSFNLYSYVLNNPLVFTDPNGLECVWDDGSFDSADDKDTGSHSGCSAQGGTYVDPKAFSTLNAGDWSNQANSDIANVASALSGNNNYTNVSVSASGSGYLDQTYMNYSQGSLYLMTNDSTWSGDTSLALATAVASDTRSLPWLCNAGLNARASIPKTGIAVGGAVDRNGAHGSLNAQLAPLPGGASLNYTQTGSKGGAQVNVPIPDTPFRASAGISSGRFNLGLSTAVPGTKNAVSAGASLSFGYLGDATCR